MLLNFTYRGLPSYAFVVYNFSQVNDAVLLVMADKKQDKDTLLFVFADGRWQLKDNNSFLSNECLSNIYAALSRRLSVFCNPSRQVAKPNIPNDIKKVPVGGFYIAK